MKVDAPRPGKHLDRTMDEVAREFYRRVCGMKLFAMYRELLATGRAVGRRAA